MFLKQLTITNNAGDSVTFDNTYKLHEEIDFSNLKAAVTYAETTTDGASYQKTTLDVRDIDVPFYLDKISDSPLWYEEKRNEIFRVFNPKRNPFKIDFTTMAENEYYITANLERTPTFFTGYDNNNEGWQICLLQFTAGDPYIYRKDTVNFEIGSWINAFKFPLVIPERGMRMGYRQPSLFGTINNTGQEETGMLIRFVATGRVINPSLIKVDSGEYFKLNVTLENGDVVEISTFRGNKSITLIRDNERSNIFHKRAPLCKFIQLDVGENLVRYDADEGLEHLTVKVKFTPKLVGV